MNACTSPRYGGYQRVDTTMGINTKKFGDISSQDSSSKQTFILGYATNGLSTLISRGKVLMGIKAQFGIFELILSIKLLY